MIPEIFKARMRSLLGNEYESFIDEIENKDAVKGVRINRIKMPSYKKEDFCDFSLTELDYASDGYIIEGADGIGHSPEHHAGIFYMQDPGAMASLSAIEVEPSWRVFDACAAPGGKSGQAAAKLSDEGFLLSNEYVPKRAKALVSNFERLGIKNAVVTSLDTAEFKDMYEAFFDLVIVDAPCSGEGMFRKSEEAQSEWSTDAVTASAKRQEEILDNVASLVKDGGYLLYSTCTYSLEENEMTVDNFLSRHPDFEITDVKESLKNASADGVRFDGAKSDMLYKTRRFYPHRARGEGQYLALMRRNTEERAARVLYKDTSTVPTKAEFMTVESFFKENLVRAPYGQVRKYADKLVLISHNVPIPKKSVFSSGVLIGEIKGKLLFPSHQFFSCYGDLFLRKIDLTDRPDMLKDYLRGMQIEAEGYGAGFCVVSYRGAVVGGGKISGGKMNNHYPKGLREL